MNVAELQRNKKTMIQKALREHYELDVDLSGMDAKRTLFMLTKVRGLLKESRQQQRNMHGDRGYLKLVMMEQLLESHYKDVRVAARIIVENEEVQKSQVILAAQEMVDQIQKMIETVSKMNAEELPAVVDGVTNEIGTNEGQQFQQSASESLTALQAALTEAKNSLSGALGAITGAEGAEAAPAFGGEQPADDMGGELPDLGGEEGADDMGGELPELPEPEEEPEELGGAGRERR